MPLQEESDWMKYLRETNPRMYQAMLGAKAHEIHIMEEKFARLQIELTASEETRRSLTDFIAKLSAKNEKQTKALDMFVSAFAAMNASIHYYRQEILGKTANDQQQGSDAPTGR